MRLLREREQEVEGLKGSLQEVKSTVQELEVLLQSQEQKAEGLKETVKELEDALAAMEVELHLHLSAVFS